MAAQSHPAVYKLLDVLLNDFGLTRDENGSEICLIGDVPSVKSTESGKLLLSLIGALPSLANAVAATQIFEARGGLTQKIEVDLRKGHNFIDPNIGMTPTINGQEITLDLIIGNPYLRNFFETKDGRYVVPSAVYVDLAYQWSSFFSVSMNENEVAAAIKTWDAQSLEDACAEAGMPLAIVRSDDEWRASPQGALLATQSIVPVFKAVNSAPKLLSPNPQRPLEGVKVLCMTHAIAGPSAGRTLAEHGASVLQIMYTHGFEHDFVYTYANLGCASSRLNLAKEGDRKRLLELVRDADVWIDSYRDGAIAKFGFDDAKLFETNPSLIVSHVRAYGTQGPWASRPGFDMQGSAVSGMMALCGDGPMDPQWPPGMVINDYTTGYYGALAIQAALLRRMNEGGGYVLSPSLAGTAMSIVRHFKTADYPQVGRGEEQPLPPDTIGGATGLGHLKTLKPLPVLSRTPIEYSPILLNPIGSDVPSFPGQEPVDLDLITPMPRSGLVERYMAFQSRMDCLWEMGRGKL